MTESSRRDEARSRCRPEILLEGALASDLLGHSLTALCGYNFEKKGRFYGAMFGLSNGLERVAKLAFILWKIEEKGEPPDNKALKDWSHDVENLYLKLHELNESYDLGVDESKVSDTLCDEIVKHISNFGCSSRYYNLNSITGGTRPDDREPLAAWDEDIGAELLRRHHRFTKKQKEERAIAEFLENSGGTVVFHTLEDGSSARDLLTFVRAAQFAKTKQKYSVWYVLCVIEFCVEILRALDFCRTPTYVYEHFQLFHTGDRQATLRRKNWDPCR